MTAIATKRFLNKKALVTGSGRGLGAATALRLASEGCDVVINDINTENAQKTAAEVEKLGQKAIVSTHDISQFAEAQKLADDVLGSWGKIDIIVNNAGITKDALTLKMTEQQWDDVVRINLKAPFNVGKAFLPKMVEQKYGKIINLSSVSWMGNIGQANYSAAKAGILGLTHTWAIEFARYGINVNAIAPGFFETPMIESIPAEVKEKLVQKIPLKRVGNPKEIAALVAFLASDESSYLTGQLIHLDGGLSVGL